MARRRAVAHHFIKILLGDFSQRLRIPPGFLKHLSSEEQYSGRAVLEGPNGGVWPVQLQKTGRDVYLSQGWKNFVESNLLREFELLLFRYEGRMQFAVSVFETSACEREEYDRVLAANYASPAHDKLGAEIKRRRPAAVTLDAELKTDQEDDVHPSDAGNDVAPSLPTHGSTPSMTWGGDRNLAMAACCNGSPRGRRGRRKSVSGFVSQRGTVSSEARERAYNAAMSFTSDLPFFISCMKVSGVYRVFLLGVPTSFAKAHLPPQRAEVILEDPAGRTWPVRYIPRDDVTAQSKLSGGWGAFARGNHLEEGDVCVFELLRPLELLVHIFRVVDEIKPR